MYSIPWKKNSTLHCHFPMQKGIKVVSIIKMHVVRDGDVGKGSLLCLNYLSKMFIDTYIINWSVESSNYPTHLYICNCYSQNLYVWKSHTSRKEQNTINLSVFVINSSSCVRKFGIPLQFRNKHNGYTDCVCVCIYLVLYLLYHLYSFERINDLKLKKGMASLCNMNESKQVCM